MDSGVKDVDSSVNCNCGSKPSYCVEESKEEADKAEEEEDDGESKSLLHSAKVANGGMAKKRQKSSRRRVQWNDGNGDKLAEILEYQPSDSSDSEDESSNGDRTWKHAIAGCIRICCYWCWGPKV